MSLRLLGLCCFALLSQSAAAYVIDGNLQPDWSINKTTMAPGSAVKGYTVEDWTRNGSGFLSPGYGGQAYDAEALYVDFDATTLYLGLITGMNPAMRMGNGNYAPGDFLIDFGRDGKFEYGFTTTDIKNTNGSAYRPTIKVGSLYRIGDATNGWYFGLWNGQNKNYANGRDPVAVKAGTLIGDGKVATSGPVSGYGQYATDTHYMYEAAIPLALFGGDWGKPFDVQWSMLCGNDVISADPVASVPEPMSLALVGSALGALALSRRKRRA
ncbi:PEP-CTERM sorting domain-containing protein [Niveibacterium umoris]|uniref:PEP-CTERM protein-sorting domain-containing protein n=1 Tax=Niveibacterium umoris TaxID=1193620 RepID=A0A840BVB6_9RHOO|nr:PEP-CTERM sorting domain-containing protein [Niveibacterium umoris]MBB4014267.1 hypothetical protein [Niveibacterium umoris]